MHVDAIEVIARLFGRDGEFRLVEQAAQHVGGRREIGGIFRRCHDREIFLWQGRQRKVRPARGHGQPARRTVFGQRHQRAVGKFSHDLVQGHSGYGCRTGALDLGRGLVEHLDVEVGGAELDAVAFGFDQHVGQDRDGVAALDHRLRLADGLEQRATFYTEFHRLSLRRRKGTVAAATCTSNLFYGFCRTVFVGRQGRDPALAPLLQERCRKCLRLQASGAAFRCPRRSGRPAPAVPRCALRHA